LKAKRKRKSLKVLEVSEASSRFLAEYPAPFAKNNGLEQVKHQEQTKRKGEERRYWTERSFLKDAGIRTRNAKGIEDRFKAVEEGTMEGV